MATLRERDPGVWTLRVAAGRDPVDGRRLTITETFRGSRAKAETRLAIMVADHERGGVDARAETLKSAINAWRAEAHHATGTIRNYDLATGTIPGHLMRTPIAKLRTATLNEFYRRIVADHGVHRARLVHAVVSGALTYAWRQEWTNGNIARRVQPPAQPGRKTTTPSAPEIRKLLEHVHQQPEIHAWLLLAAMTGGRRSEILALRWSDIDLTSGQVTIDKALDPVGGGIKSTKTEGHRKIAIGALAIEALQRWLDAFNERARAARAKPVVDPYVFAGDLAGARPWRPDVATKRFRRLIAQVGLEATRLHDLRHLVATEMLMAGVPLKVVGDRLGHTRLATTSDLYSKTIPASDSEAAETLERILT